jgi:hypothetical protein
MREKLGRLDPLNGVLNQSSEFLALLIADGGSKVPNLNQAFADKDDLSNFSDSGDQGAANQLRIEGQ